MPKKNMDYSKTMIYKLCCKNPEINDVYIGHTTNYTKRKYQHKSNCNNPNTPMHNFRVYQFIRDNGNWDNWSMIVLEECNCSNKFEAESIERHWIENLNASLNCVIPTRTEKEYRECHKERYKECHKLYQIENSEKIKEHKSKQIECECGCFSTNNNIARHRKTEKHIKLMEELNVA